MRLPVFAGGASSAPPMWALGNGNAVRVLLIDDDDDEAALTRSMLARVEDVRYKLDWVATFGEGVASIARAEHDAYLIDQRLGSRTGIELVREAREAGSLAALIMLTGRRDRATDLEAMNAGATDFLQKGRTDAALLDRTLRYSISQAALVSALERSRSQMAGLEELARILVEDGPTPAIVGRIVDLIVDRFSLRQVAIYLADGDTLYLAGQRGYEQPLPDLSRDDASVERVARARQPVFVPSITPELGRQTVAAELSVPLLVAGELAGLLNVPSSVAAPIGEEDYSAIRLVAERLTAALEVVRERTVAEERLSRSRQQLIESHQLTASQGLMDGGTFAYRRALLEPLLQVAIASAGAKASPNLGLLLVACDDAVPGALSRLAQHARTVFANHPVVRFAETELAVLVAATDEASARVQAQDLVDLARAAGLEAWCGYAAIFPGWGGVELIAAAEAALANARRLGPTTSIG